MSKYRFIYFLVLFAFQSSVAQQNNTWYFGRKAGVDFGQSPPVALHNGVMDSDEGCSTISDKAGNLLFYTNGITVYNHNHAVMLNGTGLAAHLSAVQSTIIVPMPGNTDLFYIFTTDAVEHGFANGYNYSIVDMTADNGDGAVVTKNVLLSSDCTERMTAVRAADGTSVWLITNNKNSNIFNAWLIDCNGLQPAPVVSRAGTDLGPDVYGNIGMMKVSPDGKLFCQTHYPDDAGGNNFFQLFDFNTTTGIISNGRTITLPGATVKGCEFSPDSKLLYLLRSSEKKIDQVEATLPSVAAIIASRITINLEDNYYGIQLAPDQKIYLARPSSFLSAIKNPNTKGTGCNYQKEVIDIGGNGSGQAYAGLPSFINDLSFDGANGFTCTILDSCTGKVQFNGYTAIPGPLQWDWDFGDGFTGTGQNPVHSFSSAKPGYKVIVRIQAVGGCGEIESSKQVIPTGLLLNTSFDFVAKCDSGYVRFTNTSTFLPDTAIVSYSWDFDDATTSTLQDPIHSFAGTGIFNVKLNIKTTTACLDRTISKPVNLELLDIHAPAGMIIDPGETVQLGVTGGGSRFIWTPSAGLSDARIANPLAKPTMSTMYVITAFNDAGCKDVDSVYIKVRQVPGVYVPTGFTPNNDGRNDVFKPIISDEFSLQEFTIYNRWGERLFTTSQKDIGWNGKINGIVQDPDVYVWIVNATDTRNGQKVHRKGTFVIIR